MDREQIEHAILSIDNIIYSNKYFDVCSLTDLTVARRCLELALQREDKYG